MNVSGGGVAKYTKNRADAVRFLSLTSETAQRLYGEINFEYPVNTAVPAGVNWQVGANSNLTICLLNGLPN